MADYYRLIANAVAALDENTKDTRTEIYIRARHVLGTHFRTVDAGIAESSILREIMALEQAILEVENGLEERSRATVSNDDRRQNALRMRGVSEESVPPRNEMAFKVSKPAQRPYRGQMRWPVFLWRWKSHLKIFGYPSLRRFKGPISKILLVLVSISSIAVVTYLQRNVFAALMAGLRSYFASNMWDFAVPVIGYGAVLFFMAMLFFNRLKKRL